MLSLFGRTQAQTNRRTIEALLDGIVDAVRRPVFYEDYGVADTFEGRFELLTLFAGMVLRRLNRMRPPGPDLAQDLIDGLFRRLDPSLRELGVGDLAVPKRMKRLAEAFLGRNVAYEAAIRQGRAALVAALARNVLGGAGDAGQLADYVEAAVGALDAAPDQDLLRGVVHFPGPVPVG